MTYRIEYKKEELARQSNESVRRNPGGSTVEKWEPLKRNRSVVTYPTAELAASATDHQIRSDQQARVVNRETGEVVWEKS